MPSSRHSYYIGFGRDFDFEKSKKRMLRFGQNEECINIIDSSIIDVSFTPARTNKLFHKVLMPSSRHSYYIGFGRDFDLRKSKKRILRFGQSEECMNIVDSSIID